MCDDLDKMRLKTRTPRKLVKTQVLKHNKPQPASEAPPPHLLLLVHVVLSPILPVDDGRSEDRGGEEWDELCICLDAAMKRMNKKGP